MEVRLLIAAVRRRLLLILTIGIVGGLAGATYAQGVEGEYRATAQLLLDPTAVVVPGAQQFTGDPERFVGGQIGVLRSRATAERAAESISVGADDVAETLTVERIVGSDVVDVIGRADHAQLARDVANAVAESYVAQRREQSSASVAAQLTAVEEEIAAVQQQLAALPTTATTVNPRQQAIVSQYEQLLDRRLSLTAPGVIRDATAVLDPARLPEEPQRLSSLLAGGAGALLGLLLGTAFAVLLEGRRPRVTSRLQAEHLLGRPARATFPHAGRGGDLTAVDLHAARSILALIHAQPVEGRRAIALCATAATADLDRLAAALVEVEDERGTVAELLHVSTAPEAMALDEARVSRRFHARRRADDPDRLPLSSLLLDAPPARPRAGVRKVLDDLPSDVAVAVLVLPPVLDDPSVADVARWATDVVLAIPLGQQSESDLATAQEMLSAGPARLHPVLLAKRARARR